MITIDAIKTKLDNEKSAIIENNLINIPIDTIMKNFDILKDMVFSGFENIDDFLNSNEFKKFLHDAASLYTKAEDLIVAIENFVNDYFKGLLFSFGSEIEKESALAISFAKQILNTIIPDCIEEQKNESEKKG